MTTKLVSDTDTDKIVAAFERVRDFAFPSPDSSQVQARIQREAEIEAGSTKPLLLSENGITNGMRAACIEPALDMLGDFEKAASDFETAIKPRLPEIEAWENFERKTAELDRQQEEQEESIKAKYRADKEYENIEKEYKEAEALYEQKFHEHRQRKALVPGWGYWLWLAFLGVTEGAINYTAFTEYWGIPVLALGATLTVILSTACASHWHGILLKQHKYYFGEAVERERRTRHLIRRLCTSRTQPGCGRMIRHNQGGGYSCLLDKLPSGRRQGLSAAL